VLLTLTTTRRFSDRCRRVSVIVPSPSTIPAKYAASVGESVPMQWAFCGPAWTCEIRESRSSRSKQNLQAKAPGGRQPGKMGGQQIHGFRRGLDYAFIRCVPAPDSDAERVIRAATADRILGLAQRCTAPGESMSLYRACLELASFIPLGVTMPPSRDGAVRLLRCELRFHTAFTGRCDP